MELSEPSAPDGDDAAPTVDELRGMVDGGDLDYFKAIAGRRMREFIGAAIDHGMLATAIELPLDPFDVIEFGENLPPETITGRMITSLEDLRDCARDNCIDMAQASASTSDDGHNVYRVDFVGAGGLYLCNTEGEHIKLEHVEIDAETAEVRAVAIALDSDLVLYGWEDAQDLELPFELRADIAIDRSIWFSLHPNGEFSNLTSISIKRSSGQAQAEELRNSIDEAIATTDPKHPVQEAYQALGRIFRHQGSLFDRVEGVTNVASHLCGTRIPDSDGRVHLMQSRDVGLDELAHLAGSGLTITSRRPTERDATLDDISPGVRQSGIDPNRPIEVRLWDNATITELSVLPRESQHES